MAGFANASKYENTICVSSGAGISASIAAMETLKGYRRMSLIWLVRDPSMVNHFLTNYEFPSNSYTLIYYTGKQKLACPTNHPPNVMVFTTRPNLRTTICQIIWSIQAGEVLPEDLVQEAEQAEAWCDSHDRKANRSSISDLSEIVDDPLAFLEGQLLSTLKHMSAQEIIDMLEGDEDVITFDEFEEFLFSIGQHGCFTTDVVQALEGNFAHSDACGLSRHKLVAFCKEAVLATEGEKRSMRHSASKEELESELKRTLEIDCGSANLNAYLSGMEDGGVEIMHSWGVLYCGTQEIISKSLANICQDLNIGYHEENFKW
jgi:hypothetical protein